MFSKNLISESFSGILDVLFRSDCRLYYLFLQGLLAACIHFILLFSDDVSPILFIEMHKHRPVATLKSQT